MNLEKRFKNHPISTQTVMAYVNCRFNLDNIRKNVKTIKLTKDTIGKHGELYLECENIFRNQTPLIIFITDKYITAKILPTGKIHLTGCKGLEYQRQAATCLVNHIRRANTPAEPTFTMTDNQPLNIVFDVVMVNIDFELDFEIDQKKLDNILQDPGNNFYTMYQAAITTSVNVKLDYVEPISKSFEQVIITGPPEKSTIKYTKTEKCEGSKPAEKRTHTFLVFSNSKNANNSKVIQSGRYYDTEMETGYMTFLEFIIKNREKIEFISNTATFDFECLQGLKMMPCKLGIEPKQRPKLSNK